MQHINYDELSKKLEKYFIIEKKPIDTKKRDSEKIGKTIMKEIETEDKHKFALYSPDSYYVFTLKDEQIMDTIAAEHPKIWRTLDVSILHKLILEKFLGITEKNLEDHVKYTRVDAEAIQLVNEGTYDFSFLINATKIDQLRAIADANEHMPQKSTYFLPKMLSGLVMYKMR